MSRRAAVASHDLKLFQPTNVDFGHKFVTPRPQSTQRRNPRSQFLLCMDQASILPPKTLKSAARVEEHNPTRKKPLWSGTTLLTVI